jgi:AcrR family transcriptional regulator
MTGSERAGRPGLRERKQAKTRAAIRECALRLFQAQGYEATTVEQIADAAEVLPSTFFRYFPTKEDLILADDYDPLIVAAFGAQPAGMRPSQALRAAMREVFGGLDASAQAELRQRMTLMVSVPSLRAAFADGLTQAMADLERMAARRSGRDTDAIAVRTFAGAALGVTIAAYFRWAEHPATDLVAEVDAMPAGLEGGVAL